MKHFEITETELWAYISKTADAVTIQKVEAWIDSPNFDEVLFTKTTSIYYNTSETTSDVKKAKDQFFDSINTKVNPKSNPFKNLLKYAAILVVIISGAYTYQHIVSNSDKLIIETTFGEQKQLTLSDGSKVWLNAASKLSYDKESPRTLYLEGEAFFDVAKDSAHPFTVSTSDALKVRALGTSFNVKSYLNSQITETKLITGIVEVTNRKEFKNKILLNPNEKVVFYRDNKEVIKSAMSDDQYGIAWKEGKIQFKNKIFKEIALDLKNQFDIKINFQNEHIANSKFTGSFTNTTPISEILEILKISKDFNYTLNTETNEWFIN